MTTLDFKPQVKYRRAKVRGSDFINYVEFVIELPGTEDVAEVMLRRLTPPMSAPAVFRCINLHVPADFRRAGLARMLMRELLDEAKVLAEGLPYSVFLEATPFEYDQEAAILNPDIVRRFYLALGFVPCANHPYAMQTLAK